MDLDINKILEKMYGKNYIKEEIYEVILDQHKIQELKDNDKKILESLSDAVLLSMNDCGLKSLNNLPKFPNLELVKFLFYNSLN